MFTHGNKYKVFLTTNIFINLKIDYKYLKYT